MSGIRDLLIRGSEKVIAHYRLLLARAKNEKERELYELHGCFPDRFAA
jgi:hypothetical protein